MKRVSARMFFTVLWRGLCQALGWFFGLFGYKRDGKFAKCVWGVFSVSAAVIMGIIAIVFSMEFYDYIKKQNYWDNYCEIHGGQYVSEIIGYVPDYEDGDGYLINKKTGKKVLKNIDWIALPLGKDSLVCFSSDKKRGYFNAKNGNVVVEPKYDHAWIFSDGLGAVEEDGRIKFLDSTGKIVIDNGMKYDGTSDGYVFHGGYIAVCAEASEKYGLMDKTGNMVLPLEYDYIDIANNLEYWRVRKDKQWAVYDKNMNQILPFIDGCVYITDSSIDVAMSDHTMRKYDFEGNLINDFYISETRHLTYDTGEVYYAKDSYTDDDGDEQEYLEERNKQATARLRAYAAVEGYEGLMTPEGHVITMPLYENIEAIGPDTYLCTVSDGDKVVVNGKGEVVR